MHIGLQPPSNPCRVIALVVTADTERVASRQRRTVRLIEEPPNTDVQANAKALLEAWLIAAKRLSVSSYVQRRWPGAITAAAPAATP